MTLIICNSDIHFQAFLNTQSTDFVELAVGPIIPVAYLITFVKYLYYPFIALDSIKAEDLRMIESESKERWIT